MRIITGAFKGARLFTPKSQQIRPTSDRVREYIFSCINEEIQEARVLDLFAGTGALGIEALSRGAQSAVFVDNASASVELIKRNLDKLKTSAVVVRRSAEAFLKTAAPAFDFVFCDPPYQYERFDFILELISANSLLDDSGTIIYESAAREKPPLPPGFCLVRQKKMGDTLITFYQLDYDKSSNLSRDV